MAVCTVAVCGMISWPGENGGSLVSSSVWMASYEAKEGITERMHDVKVFFGG